MGKFQPLVLLLRFTDHKSRELPSQFFLDILWNSEGLNEHLPKGSIRRYIEQNSYGAVDVRASVTDWIDTDNTESYYSFGKSGLDYRLAEAIHPVLDHLDNMGYDFAQNDINSDMVIDNLVVMHSGFPAEVGGTDCYTQNTYQNRIWSQAVGSTTDRWRSKKGYSFNQYTVSSAIRGDCKSNLARIGTITHELMHSFGLRDLYDLSGEFIGQGTGVYSILSNPHGWAKNKAYPSHLDPYSKIQLGWVTPIPLNNDGFYTIDASALSPQVYMVQQGFPEGEYLLIENRQQLEYDDMMYGSGLLI